MSFFFEAAQSAKLTSQFKKIMPVADADLIFKGRFPAVEKFVGGFDGEPSYFIKYLTSHFDVLSGVIATEDMREGFDRLTANEVRLLDDPSIHDGSATDNVGNIKLDSWSFEYRANTPPKFAVPVSSERWELFGIDPDRIPAESAYQWWRLSVYGVDDSRNIKAAKERGWKVVPLDRHPEVEINRDQAEKNRIVMHGMLLMEIPRKLWDARAADDFERTKETLAWQKATFEGDGLQVVEPKPTEAIADQSDQS